jgi:hypothetical protein
MRILNQEEGMPQRIITDSRGQRWDVVQDNESSDVVFRHQSGNELRSTLDGTLDALSTEALLDALDSARQEQGLDEVGHGGLDVAFDPEGYETGR